MGTRMSRSTFARTSGVAMGAGLYAPIPPVLGPASPSPIALVGVADATGSFRLPAPVPLQPSLIGVRLFVQGVALANGGALLGLADLSDAYALVIGS